MESAMEEQKSLKELATVSWIRNNSVTYGCRYRTTTITSFCGNKIRNTRPHFLQVTWVSIKVSGKMSHYWVSVGFNTEAWNLALSSAFFALINLRW